MSLTFNWGNYQHPVGEVYPRSIEIRPLFTNDGIRWASSARYQLAGNFCSDPLTPLTPATIDTKIAGLIAAYDADYQDFGFKLNGVKTSHFVENDNPFNLSGNRILSRSWDYRGAEEFANTRSFGITVGATFQNSYSQIISYNETTEQLGNGGEKWTYRPNWLGPPTRTTIYDQTPVQIVQQGTIVGLNLRPSLPARYWPSDEHEDMRVVKRYSPRFHGHLDFDRGTHYRLDYAYFYSLATVPSAEPIEWRIS